MRCKTWDILMLKGVIYFVCEGCRAFIFIIPREENTDRAQLAKLSGVPNPGCSS